MEQEFKNIDLFERRSKNQLSTKENLTFDKRLESDKEFLEEYTFYHSMLLVLKEEDENTIKSDLLDIHAKLEQEGFFKEKKTPKKTPKVQPLQVDRPVAKIVPWYRKTRGLSIVASILFLLSFGIPNIRYSNSNLMNEQKERLIPDLGASRGASKIDVFKKGKDAIKNKQYQEAIKFFESIAASDETYTKARYNIAYSFFELKNYKAVIENTEIILASAPSNELKENSEWLQIQSMLALGETENKKFQSLLNSLVVDSDHKFNDEATTLQNKLTSFWRKLVFI